MKLTLTSIKKRVLDINNLESATIPTQSGEITILSKHEPLISALKPGILKLKYSGKKEEYAIGGGVLETNGEHLSLIADMVEDGEGLNIEEIKAKKEEAKKLLEEYKENNKEIDMDRYIQLEQEFLKESAKEQLAIK